MTNPLLLYEYVFQFQLHIFHFIGPKKNNPDFDELNKFLRQYCVLA